VGGGAFPTRRGGVERPLRAVVGAGEDDIAASADALALLDEIVARRTGRAVCAALPVLWGPGGKPFRGRVLDLPETSGCPRPLQEHVPIVLGGGGERRTLRLAARYAEPLTRFADVIAAFR
jgi:alkanesulfonate monooxygenase SsuD/methylene tetrahydromethanopterin reductase-like flavin-dependent oxidoreductase (luciferase family)